MKDPFFANEVKLYKIVLWNQGTYTVSVANSVVSIFTNTQHCGSENEIMYVRMHTELCYSTILKFM